MMISFIFNFQLILRHGVNNYVFLQIIQNILLLLFLTKYFKCHTFSYKRIVKEVFLVHYKTFLSIEL